MKYSKSNLIAVEVSGKDAGDLELHQVHFTSDGATVASDGVAIMAVQPVNPKRVPPSLPSLTEETEPGEDGVGVKPSAIREVLKNLPKGNLGLELGYCIMTKNDKAVELLTTDLNVEQRVRSGKARKRFPEWKGVLRKAFRKCKTGVVINRKALINLLQAIDSACPDPDSAVFMEFNSSGGSEVGVLLRAMNIETGQRVIGYVLPLNTGGEWMKLNKWERQIFAKGAKRLQKRIKEE